MKIDKAINLSHEAEESLRKNNFADHAEAVKLGEEALKALSAYRQQPFYSILKQLPGEDPE